MHSELPWPPFACSWRLAHIALPLPAARRKLTHCTWKSRKYRRLQMETWSASLERVCFLFTPRRVRSSDRHRREGGCPTFRLESGGSGTSRLPHPEINGDTATRHMKAHKPDGPIALLLADE